MYDISLTYILKLSNGLIELSITEKLTLLRMFMNHSYGYNCLLANNHVKKLIYFFCKL